MISIGKVLNITNFARLAILTISATTLSAAWVVNAHAASAYDSVVILGEPKVICSDSYEIDVGTSYYSLIKNMDTGFRNAVESALDYGSGWALSQFINPTTGEASVIMTVTPSPTDYTPYFANADNWLAPTGMLRYLQTKAITIECGTVGSNSHSLTYSLNTATANRYIAYTNSAIGYDMRPIYVAADIDYPTGYAGVIIPDTLADVDDDSLSDLQEQSQGTSDSSDDTDGDGLSDYVESSWYEDRDDVFCDKTTTPYTCEYPDPTKKDIYVEVDWMDDGTIAYKPTSTQLGLVEDMFGEYDINLHFDVGEYGGGNELSTYTSSLLNSPTLGEVDFSDYKSGGDSISPNFSTDRNYIWRYLIAGNTYTVDGNMPSGSSGWASVMGSNIFVAIGAIKNDEYVVSQDRAIANSIAHEIGHSICLSDSRLYNEQPAGCIYEGIDNNDDQDDYYNLTDYESVMNYRYQLTDFDDFERVDYSDGSRDVIEDHNDWSGVVSSIGKFNKPRTFYTEFGARGTGNSYILDNDGNIIVE